MLEGATIDGEIHGNSKTNTKPLHGYQIADGNNVVQEFGVSSQKLNADGTSLRVTQKLRIKYYNAPGYRGEVVAPYLQNRKAELNLEYKRYWIYATDR